MIKRNSKRKSKLNIFSGNHVGIVIISCMLLLTTIIPTFGLADDADNTNVRTYHFNFHQPQLKQVNVMGSTFTNIEVDGCQAMCKEVGSPKLPTRFVRLLLPPGKIVKDITYHGSLQQLPMLGSTLQDSPVVPHQASVPIGYPVDDGLMFNQEAYESSQTKPTQNVMEESVSYSHGYAILSLAICPVQYIADTGELSYYTDMSISITLEDHTTQLNKFYRGTVEDKEWVKRLVSNPKVADEYPANRFSSFSYPGGLCDPSENYDYVIITTTHNGLDHWDASTITPSYNWTSLMNKHAAQDGLSCTLVTVQDIYACSDYYNSSSLFNDSAAQIREFCRDAYQDWGISYVLVGGDHEWIPRRGMWYEGENSGWSGTPPLETDIYWSNLDNTFNDDGDDKWGESGDTGFDLDAELYIGSLTCDEPQDIANWMNKSFYYADSMEKDYLENAAFYGGDTGWTCQGDDFIDYSAIQGTDDWLGPNPHNDGPFPTWAGFQFGFETWNSNNIGKEYNLSVKWTAEPPNPGWMGGTETQAINGLKNAINSNNVTLISGIAHANSGMSLDVYDSDWESDYHNTKPFFIHDFGCHCGDMEHADDGVLHSMLFHSDTELAIGCVYNTGYGWGNLGGTNSSSAFQQKAFWDYLFDTTNNSGSTNDWQLGKAQAWTKNLMAPTINWDPSTETWRGIIQSCLLFGDPAQRIKSPFQPEHGISVTGLNVPSTVPHNKTIYVEALVRNLGSNNETNIQIDFSVDSTTINSTTIPFLGLGESQLVSFAWNPDVGSYVVSIEAIPVPGENITSNNEVNKTVNVVYAPDIWLNPNNFDFFMNANDIDSDTLTIGNELFAEAPLHFNLSLVSDSSWLSVTPDTGSVPVGQNVNITVTVDTAGMSEGQYSDVIKVTSDDLEDPLLSVPVTLEVVYAKDITPICVNAPVGVNPIWGTYTVNATVKNIGTDDQTGIIVNCSIRELGEIITQDFEDDDGGYIHGDGPGPGSIDDWEWGEPTYGPSSAHSGSHVWATNLDSDHSNSADGVLDSQEVDLAMFSPMPELSFWHWYDHTIYDCGNVKISTDGGTTWELIYPESGYPGTASSGNQGIPNEPAFTDISTGWEEVVFNLSDYEGEQVKFRWHFGSTSSSTHPGWYIDDVSFASGIAQRSPGDIVYSSQATVDLLANTQAFVEFSPSWHPPVGGAYAFNIETYLSGDEDPTNDDLTSGAYFTAPNQETFLSELMPEWNFVSVPFNSSVLKEYLKITYNGSVYNWTEATTSNNPTGTALIDSNIIGWDAAIQLYSPDDMMKGGTGYFLYSYVACGLWADHISAENDDMISPINTEWNIVGAPTAAPIEKADVLACYDGVMYNWTEATTINNPTGNPLIDGNVFSWNSTSQSYAFGDVFLPGCAYWLYSFEDIELYRIL